MITLDALGKDGSIILPDLQGASPGGGLVTSEWRACGKLAPGDVVRHDGWAVIAGISHDGVTGTGQAALITAVGEISRRFLVAGEGMDTRTDTRIDPRTLYKLMPREPVFKPGRGDDAVEFAARAARLRCAGEGTGGDDREHDDAFAVLDQLIADARNLLGWTPGEPPLDAGQYQNAGLLP